MGTHYSQLTPLERNRIETLLKQGMNQVEIAFALGRNKSTISREIKRNAWMEVCYFSHTAQVQSTRRRCVASSRMKVDPLTWERVEEKLLLKWSPEQISARLKLENKGRISVSTIYAWIWLDRKSGGGLYKNLRISNRRRKKRNLPLRQKGPIQGEKSIHLRPKIVEKRKRLGDLEGDTIHFSKNRKTGLLTITDRVSKKIQIRKLPRRQAKPTAKQSIHAITLSRSKMHTLTLDRGPSSPSSNELKLKRE